MSRARRLAAALALCAALAAGPALAAGQDRCRILITNDDGAGAPGIAALYRALKPVCDVLVAAPATDQSGASHSIPDARRGFAARAATIDGEAAGYAVEGTPAEATALGLIQFGRERPFDLVVSGINRGENTGLANLYSGTVNAGMEALVRGVPAIAVSQSSDYGADYRASAEVAVRVVRQALNHGLPRGVMLNVNVPIHPNGRVAVLPAAGLSGDLPGFDARPQPDGAVLYAPRFAPAAGLDPAGDAAAYRKGDITIAPLALDRTAYRALAPLRAWTLGAGRATGVRP
jgi:5'-nucleotidase